jgi:hypothetical protein
MKVLLLLITLFSCAYVHSQDTFSSKHSVGIDFANVITFLKRNNQSYLANYWYNIDNHYSIRSALNFDIGTSDADGIYPSLKVGIQKNKRQAKWNYFYGADLSYTYYKGNTIPISNARYGISPFIGVEYFLSKRFSLNTEISLNCYYTQEKNNSTFSTDYERNYYRAVIGSVGMIILKFNI